MTIHSNKISIENAGYYRSAYKYNSISQLHDFGKMHGAKRVATFCILTAVLPTFLIIIPLYLRHSVFADVRYEVAESDVIEIHEGISTIFCQEHELTMNSSFNAYQFSGNPDTSTKRKNIQLKKSMLLPDDTLEYWGFYLLKGATVELKACSRFDGARIMVVRGERNLRTCGLLDHNKNKIGPNMDRDYKQVQVILDTHAQEIKSDNDENTAAEDHKNKADELDESGDRYITRHNKKHSNSTEKTNCKDPSCKKEKKAKRKRHQLEKELNEDVLAREKRETSHKLDGGIEHGGTALNYTDGHSEESSFSSFESNLNECYDGYILLTQGFPPSSQCNKVQYLEKNIGDNMKVVHDVLSDGYYYYIFYSDNDITSNEIHVVFNISKPTFQHTNISKDKECINSTKCNFIVSFASDETVIVEVPTRDGIEHEEDDITLLISTCKPRMAVYIIFPISILFLILGCAFL